MLTFIGFLVIGYVLLKIIPTVFEGAFKFATIIIGATIFFLIICFIVGLSEVNSISSIPI